MALRGGTTPFHYKPCTSTWAFKLCAWITLVKRKLIFKNRKEFKLTNSVWIQRKEDCGTGKHEKEALSTSYNYLPHQGYSQRDLLKGAPAA